MWSALCWSHLPKVYRNVCPSSSSSTLSANLTKEPQDRGFEGPVFPECTSPWPTRASQVVLVVKNLPANAGDIRDAGFGPWVAKTPWRSACQLIPVFQSRESQGQRSLGYGVQDHKESDMIEATQDARTHPHLHPMKQVLLLSQSYRKEERDQGNRWQILMKHQMEEGGSGWFRMTHRFCFRL